jgi:hypothetical protein
MNENDIFVIQMNIARYRSMLQGAMDGEKRSMIERLLAEAQRDLTAARAGEKRA